VKLHYGEISLLKGGDCKQACSYLCIASWSNTCCHN